jgi:chromosome segregation ATPase
LERQIDLKIKEIEALKEAKKIEDMLVVKLKVNTEELKDKKTTIEKLLKEKQILEEKVQSISETVGITQANEDKLQQEIEYFKKQFNSLSKSAESEKVEFRPFS